MRDVPPLLLQGNMNSKSTKKITKIGEFSTLCYFEIIRVIIFNTSIQTLSLLCLIIVGDPHVTWTNHDGMFNKGTSVDRYEYMSKSNIKL
jgi:hypothetical protein